eukprot:XP_025000265.1 coiled-coil domain-containing protein 9 isoform X2 [Gallus gallus]
MGDVMGMMWGRYRVYRVCRVYRDVIGDAMGLWDRRTPSAHPKQPNPTGGPHPHSFHHRPFNACPPRRKPPGQEAEVVHPRGALWESDGRVRRNATMAAALDVGSKEQKDAALDRRIAALRKKNEALVRRYQEIEEDRRRAELRGGAVTAPRRTRDPQRRYGATEQPPAAPPGNPPLPPPDPPGPPRAPQDRSAPYPKYGGWRRGPYGCRGGAGGARAEGSGSGGQRSCGGGGDGVDRRNQEWEERRRQNIERMNEEMEKIAEYERNQRDGVHERNPVRNFLDDPRRCGPAQEEGSRRHGRNWGGPDFEGVRAGMEREKGRSPKAADVTLSMTGRERAEYERWKRERERIDRERLARHRQPTGQWRREWDAHKSDSMFKDGAPPSDPAPHNPPSLPPPRTERRRKGRGRSPPPSKPYSMHDDRWEEEEGVEEEQQQQQETRTPPRMMRTNGRTSAMTMATPPPPRPPSVPPPQKQRRPPPAPPQGLGEEMENGAPPTAPPRAQKPPPPRPPPAPPWICLISSGLESAAEIPTPPPHQ